MRLRLLPADGYSWVGYVWLVYLAMPIAYACWIPSRTPQDVAITAAGIAAFLPLYFWGYWVGSRLVIVPIAAITLLAIAIMPFNGGGGVFFVYAAGFAGRTGRVATGVTIMAAILLVIGIEAWLVGLPPATWGYAVSFTLMIGGLNVSFAEIGRRQMVLRQAAERDAQRMAIIAERERISRDLHDLLGHTLSVIAIKADLASKLASRDPARSLAEIRDVERISRDALAEVRKAVTGSPAALLADELRNAHSALEAAGIALEARVAHVPLPPDAERALALALREAVTNVVRHSRARRCTIRLLETGGVVELAIEDDGVGGTMREGSGIAGMRERIGAVGGEFERNGQRGTCLTMRIPRVAVAIASVAGHGRARA